MKNEMRIPDEKQLPHQQQQAKLYEHTHTHKCQTNQIEIEKQNPVSDQPKFDNDKQ